jgi:hypothetical protein
MREKKPDVPRDVVLFVLGDIHIAETSQKNQLGPGGRGWDFLHAPVGSPCVLTHIRIQIYLLLN